jgi:hypothetical protein
VFFFTSIYTFVFSLWPIFRKNNALLKDYIPKCLTDHQSILDEKMPPESDTVIPGAEKTGLSFLAANREAITS